VERLLSVPLDRQLLACVFLWSAGISLNAWQNGLLRICELSYRPECPWAFGPPKGMETRLLFSNCSQCKRRPCLCHPEQLNCLRQLAREMTPAIATDARPVGPTAKRQPSPEGLGNQPPRGSERRRRGTLSPQPASVLCRKTFPGRACRTADPSASLGIVKGEGNASMCVRSRGGENRRSFHFATLRSG
jgi:hypothetical protein